MSDIKIQDTKDVWVAWANTDNTEGRGFDYPKYVCQTEATAIRKGKNGFVQGSNCPVSKSIAIKIDNTWLVPGKIVQATSQDMRFQIELDRRRSLIEKAKKAGFTDDDLKLMASTTKPVNN
jgi:N-acetylglucosamine-6-phosphate deacetylase